MPLIGCAVGLHDRAHKMRAMIGQNMGNVNAVIAFQLGSLYVRSLSLFCIPAARFKLV